MGDQAFNLRARHQGGRAATEMQARQRPRAAAGAPMAHIGEDRIEQRVFLAFGTVDVEIAIGTDPGAIGPVDIEAERIGERVHRPNSAATRASRARPRWLIACFSAALISANVRSCPCGWKIAS